MAIKRSFYISQAAPTSQPDLGTAPTDAHRRVARFPSGFFEAYPPYDRNPEQYYDYLESMPAMVRLNDIIDALEMQFDESSFFLDRDTGQAETVSHALLREAEDEEPNVVGLVHLALAGSSSFPARLSILCFALP